MGAFVIGASGQGRGSKTRHDQDEDDRCAHDWVNHDQAATNRKALAPALPTASVTPMKAILTALLAILGSFASLSAAIVEKARALPEASSRVVKAFVDFAASTKRGLA